MVLEKLKDLRGVLWKQIKGEEEKEKPFHFKIYEPKHLITLSTKEENVKDIDAEYPLLEPYSHAHIKWSNVEGELIYRIIQPELSEKEKELYKKISNALTELVDVELSTVKKPEKAMSYIEDKIKKILYELDLSLTKTQFAKIMYHIYRNFVGLNKIEPLMHDPYIEDISCDGLGTPIYVTHKRFGSIKTNIKYEDPDELRDFVVKLGERCGRYISYAEPLVDGSLPDGSRVQASLAQDVTTKGPTFSIRKFSEEPFSPTDMIDLKTASPELLAYLWFCIENGTSILVCGGVSSGKTSFLNSISLFIPPQDKIVSIESSRELNIPHENWIPAVVRLGFGMPTGKGERYGEVSMFDLLKESFRQNPDYVIVGEVRGEEAYVMFQGISSGNPCMGTMHAGGADTVVKRLESPPIELSPSLVEGLDLVITMMRAKEKGKSARRVKKIVEIRRVESDTGKPVTESVFSWIPSEDQFERGTGDKVLDEIAKTKGLSMKNIKKEIENRKKLVSWMHEKDIKDWREVAKIVSQYTRDPKSVLDEAGIDTEVAVRPKPQRVRKESSS